MLMFSGKESTFQKVLHALSHLHLMFLRAFDWALFSLVCFLFSGWRCSSGLDEYSKVGLPTLYFHHATLALEFQFFWTGENLREFLISGCFSTTATTTTTTHHSNGRSAHTKVTHSETIVEESFSVLVSTGLCACLCYLGGPLLSYR